MAAKSALIVLALLVLASSFCVADDEHAGEPSESSMLISNIHMWRGNQYERGGRLDLATENYLKASAYLRTSPDPHFALARVYLRRSIMDAFLEMATGIKLLMSDFFYQSLILSNLLLVIIIAVGFAFYVATVVIVVRHAKTLWLSAIISIPARLKGSYPHMIIVVSVLSFFLLLSGQSLPSIVTWTTVVGCAMVWRFASASERRTIAGFVVFLILIGFALSFTGRIVSTQHPQSQLRTAALADRISEERLQQAFAASNRNSRYEPIADFMRGYMLLRSGEYSTAIERLNLASKFAPNNAAIQNNLGVAYHGLGRYQQAGAQFENALRLAPREAIVHYNYSQTLNALLHYDLAQEELAEASALDFDLTRSLVTRKEAASPVPMNLQTRVLWQMALDYDDAAVKLDYHPIEAGPLGTLILIIVAGAAFALIRKVKCPARCEVCGSVVGTQMTKRKRKDRLCATCNKIRLRNVNDHRELEAEYERRLRMLATRSIILRIVLGLVVPGTSYHLAGKRFRGFMSSAVVIALLVLALGGGAVIRAVPVFRTEPTVRWALPLFGIAYVIYAWRSSVTAIRSVKEE